jgi:hypothetical protein
VGSRYVADEQRLPHRKVPHRRDRSRPPAIYADVRAHPGRFVIAAGHGHPGGEIASHDGYVVIEDHELAAELKRS